MCFFYLRKLKFMFYIFIVGYYPKKECSSLLFLFSLFILASFRNDFSSFLFIFFLHVLILDGFSGDLLRSTTTTTQIYSDLIFQITHSLNPLLIFVWLFCLTSLHNNSPLEICVATKSDSTFYCFSSICMIDS